MAKVLVVDDDPDVVEACCLVLEQKGHKVSSAYNRADGMKAIKTEKPDLLILDVMMEQPDDGLAMAQDLRRDGYSAPILMLTSISKVTGLSYGKDSELVPVDDFVEKPVSAATLTAKVAELLAKKSQGAAKESASPAKKIKKEG
ncbi:MAG: response regulator [Planctomycetota bacterium]|nr:response regulator [Planctomycetota bacterium]